MRVAFGYDPVKRDFLSGTDEDFLPGSDLSRGDGLDTFLLDEVGIVLLEIHKSGNGFPRFIDGAFLKDFSDLEENKDGNCFRIFSEGQGSQSSNSHEEIFIENFSLQEVGGGIGEDVPPDDEIGNDGENNTGRCPGTHSKGDSEKDETCERAFPVRRCVGSLVSTCCIACCTGKACTA